MVVSDISPAISLSARAGTFNIPKKQGKQALTVAERMRIQHKVNATTKPETKNAEGRHNQADHGSWADDMVDKPTASLSGRAGTRHTTSGAVSSPHTADRTRVSPSAPQSQAVSSKGAEVRGQLTVINQKHKEELTALFDKHRESKIEMNKKQDAWMTVNRDKDYAMIQYTKLRDEAWKEVNDAVDSGRLSKRDAINFFDNDKGKLFENPGDGANFKKLWEYAESEKDRLVLEDRDAFDKLVEASTNHRETAAALTKSSDAFQEECRQALFINDKSDLKSNFSDYSEGETANKDYENTVVKPALDFVGRIVDKTVMTNEPVDVKVYSFNSGDGRACEKDGKIYLYPNDKNWVVIHEVGHVLEERSPDIHAKAVAFLDKRTPGEDAVQLKALHQSSSYRDDEFTRKDNFMEPYMGKVYYDPAKGTYATEIVSMGLQFLYEKPAMLAEQDPEYFDFMIDLVRGGK